MTRHQLLCIMLATLAALSPAHGQDQASERSALEAFVAEEGKEAVETNHQIQALLLSFADYYAESLKDAYTTLLEEELEPAVRASALAGRVTPAYRALLIAASTNPRAALIDMVTYVRILARAIEQTLPTIAETIGERQAQRLLRVHQRLATQVTALAQRFMPPEALAEIDAIVQRWKTEESDEDDPDLFAQAVNVTALAGLSPGARTRGSSFLGIGDATRAIDEARILGERAVHVVERLPVVATWIAEAAFFRAISTPEARRSLESLQRLPGALDDVATTIGALPPIIERERNALLEGVAAQQAGVATLLTEARSTIDAAQPLVTELRTSLDSGERVAADVARTAETFAGTVEATEALTARAERLLASAGEGGMDLAAASTLLDEAQEIVVGLDRTLATVERLVGGEGADPFSSLRNVGVTLIVVFFACALAAALTYRYAAARIAPART